MEILETERYSKWLAKLRDRRARARILGRVTRLSQGNPGDVKSVGGGISELRLDYGPGYRIYYVQHGENLILLLAGGDKSTQQQDIETATDLYDDWLEQDK